jgi:hypothetical protein
MPLQENIDTFRYFISEADALDLGYICLVRYNPALDPEIDGMAVHTVHVSPIKYFSQGSSGLQSMTC